jgi:hypothetical protein
LLSKTGKEAVKLVV